MKLSWDWTWDSRYGERQTKRAYVVHSSDGAPYDLVGFIKWLSDIYDSIPDEFKQYAEVNITHEEYGDPFDIRLIRPESDEEYAERKAKEDKAAEKKKVDAAKNELKTYERLKRKYE